MLIRLAYPEAALFEERESFREFVSDQMDKSDKHKSSVKVRIDFKGLPTVVAFTTANTLNTSATNTTAASAAAKLSFREILAPTGS